MSDMCCSDAGGTVARRRAGVQRLAEMLALAASPTFAVMALLTTALSSGATEMLCAATHPSPLSGMATMYLLMSAFHVGPWLKLLRA